MFDWVNFISPAKTLVLIRMFNLKILLCALYVFFVSIKKKVLCIYVF